VAVAAALATVWLFVLPPSGAPARADAVVVLSGDRGERLATALDLLDRGVSRTLVHVGTPDSDRIEQLCRRADGQRVVCLRPAPDDTAQEARALGRLADRRGWRRLAVVTSTYHVTRARLLIGRCFDGEVRMVKAAPDIPLRTWLRQLLHEWGGLGEALVLRRGCGG